MRRRSSASASASCTRSLTMIASAGSSVSSAITLCPASRKHRDRVGQVVLALRVLGAQTPQRGREQTAPEAVDRRVDLVDLALLVGGVGVLHDARDAPVLAPHDAAETVGLGDGRGEDRGGRVLRRGARWRAARSSPRARAVRRRATRGCRPRRRDRRRRVERDAHRVAGAALHALLHELDRHLGDELVVQSLRHPLGRVARPRRRSVRAAARRARRRRAAPSDDRRADAAPSACSERIRVPSPAARTTALRGRYCFMRAPCHVLLTCAHGLGGEGSNLDSGLQRTLCCRYTTPETSSTIPAARGRSRGRLVASPFVMGSLIKKRRKRMRKKKHKKLLKKTRWQRRQQGK